MPKKVTKKVKVTKTTKEATKVDEPKIEGISVETLKVELTLLDPMLGTKPGSTELMEDYIMSKNPEGPSEDEQFDPEQDLEKGTTVFFRIDGDDKKPAIFDYMIKGFFKDAQGCLNKVPATKMSAHKKIIDGLVFIKERQIPITLPKGTGLTICERPLRASTPMGERVALSRSEECPAGSKLTFTIQVLDKKLLKEVKRWLDYGQLRGLGQWRNSGKGRFTWREV